MVGSIWVKCGRPSPLNWGQGYWVNRAPTARRMAGELVFTTGMVGYTETLTDPSYAGQIVVFAYPLIGNYGVPAPLDGKGQPSLGFESKKIQAAGAIVGWASPDHSHWSAQTGLREWMDAQGVGLLEGVDTRALIQWMRDTRQRERAPVLGLVQDASRDQLQGEWRDPGSEVIWPTVSVAKPELFSSDQEKSIAAVVDCGVKWNMIRQLNAEGVSIWLLPWNTDLVPWLKAHPQVRGLVISNGPGDPSRAESVIQNVRILFAAEATHRIPILGICLGHQILALAAGGRTARMEYGHRSHNQPVVEEGGTKIGRGWLTSQNHGYVVEEEGLPPEWRPWFRNANDQSIEGIRHRSHPWRSVQFHPEAAGGPRDTSWIIQDFVRELRGKS